MEIGVYTLARVAADPHTGALQTPEEHMRDLLDEIELADELGFDLYGIGENHRPDYAVSAPAVVLAAAAARTKRIRLSSMVSILSADDPVRVFQDFATLDLLSGGRAEILAGRGISTESFPLFGYDVADYDELFAEKLDLLMRVRDDEHVTWSGAGRPPLDGQGVYPRPVQQPLPVWIAVGGNPDSAARTGRLGLPMALAFLTGTYQARKSLQNVYREAAEEAGHDPDTLPVALSCHCYIADSTKAATEEFLPYYANAMNALAIERGFPLIDKRRFRAMSDLDGPVIAGTPDEVIEKILYQHDIFKHQRLLLQISVGALPLPQLHHAMNLLAHEVVPAVRAELAKEEGQLVTARSTA